MTGREPRRDGEIEAFVVDRYLESLLARGPLDPTDVPADLRAAAHRLASGLPRYHPSFRFEEYLAARLLAAASARVGELIDFPARAGTDALPVSDRSGPVRPALIGGVLTSAVLSLAGAVYVAWRRGRQRSSRRPAEVMTRAVRAVARARTV